MFAFIRFFLIYNAIKTSLAKMLFPRRIKNLIMRFMEIIQALV